MHSQKPVNTILVSCSPLQQEEDKVLKLVQKKFCASGPYSGKAMANSRSQEAHQFVRDTSHSVKQPLHYQFVQAGVLLRI